MNCRHHDVPLPCDTCAGSDVYAPSTYGKDGAPNDEGMGTYWMNLFLKEVRENKKTREENKELRATIRDLRLQEVQDPHQAKGNRT